VDALRWSVCAQDVIGTVSPRANEVHLFDLGVCDCRPTHVLQGEAGSHAAGGGLATLGNHDLAFFASSAHLVVACTKHSGKARVRGARDSKAAHTIRTSVRCCSGTGAADRDRGQRSRRRAPRAASSRSCPRPMARHRCCITDASLSCLIHMLRRPSTRPARAAKCCAGTSAVEGARLPPSPPPTRQAHEIASSLALTACTIRRSRFRCSTP
jgi:hypothetical protein